MKVTVIRAHYVGKKMTQFEQKEVTEQFVKNCADARNFFIGLGGLYKIKKDSTGRVVFIENISPDRKERALVYFVYGDIENAEKNL